MSRRTVLAVIGGADEGSETLTLATRVGAAICQAGCHLVCGGRGGVMAAACRGFVEARFAGAGTGVTIGVLPGDDCAEANPYVDVALPTGIGLARNAIVVRGAEGIVAVGGSSGTLSEIALAWQFGRPIVPIAGSGGWAEELAGQTLDKKGYPPILPASPPEEAVELIVQRIRRGT